MSSARPGGARTVRGRAACRAVRARRALVSGGVRSRFQEFTHVLPSPRGVARPARARMRGRVRVACRPCGSTDAARSATTRGGVERAADAAAPASAVAIAPPAPVAGETLSAVSVTAQRQPVDPDTPAVVTSITREQIESHTNVTTEDALKYAPNLMVRKRYIGDRNSVFAGRDFNELQSARGPSTPTACCCRTCSARYAYPPRWSLIPPDDIARVDVLYGPFSALYPGNSIGSTVLLTTRRPESSRRRCRRSSSRSASRRLRIRGQFRRQSPDRADREPGRPVLVRAVARPAREQRSADAVCGFTRHTTRSSAPPCP